MTKACIIYACVVVAAVLAAVPPRGTRSSSESKSLHESRQNTLHRKMPNVVDLKADFFDKYVKPHHWKENRSRYWLVLFYSSWCLTCEDFSQPLRDLAEKVHERRDNEHTVVYKSLELPRGQLSIGKHDVTFGEVIAEKYGVEGYPTVLLFDRDDDKKITKFEGIPSTDALLQFVRTNTDVKL